MDQAKKKDILSLDHPKYTGYLHLCQFGIIMDPPIRNKDKPNFVDTHGLRIEPNFSPPYHSVIVFGTGMKLLDLNASKVCTSQSMNKISFSSD